jgi:hypothetical protein
MSNVPQNLQLRQYNSRLSNTTETLVFDRSFTRAPFIENTSGKKITISKFSIPVNNPLLQTTYTADWAVEMTSVILSPNQVNTTRLNTASAVIPASDIYTSDAFVDKVNKALLLCYSLLNDNSACKTTIQHTSTYTNASPSVNFNMASLPTQTKFLSSVDLGVNVGTSDKYAIYLESPTAVKKHVVTAWLNAGKTYQFADFFDSVPNDKAYDGVFRPGNQSEATGELYLNDTVTSAYGQFEPTDAFSGFLGASPVGNWKVYIYRCRTPFGTYSVQCDVTLNLITSIFSGSLYYSATAPFISLDKDTGKFSWHADERFLQTCDLYLGSSLQQILCLEKYTPEDNGYLKKIKFPLYTGTMTDASVYTNYIQVFEAQVPRAYLINKIEEILINSSSFNILNRDLLDGEVSTNVITSFSINADDLQTLDYLSFFYQGSMDPFRSYELSANQGIHNIRITVQVRYRDGTIQDCFLLPSQSASLVLSVY